MTDKKRLYIISAASLAVLLILFLIPFEAAGRVLAAVAMAAAAVVSWFFIKKRTLPSIHRGAVLGIMALSAVLYLLLYYLSGLALGYHRNMYSLNATSFFGRVLPILAIIVATEVYRWIVRAQGDRKADFLCYIACVLAELVAHSTAPVAFVNYERFMGLLAATFFPSVVANLLYHYISKRYGILPNIAYRAITTLYLYVIPITPALSDSLRAFVSLFVPILLYYFIGALYEKKRRYALVKKSKLAPVVSVLTVFILAGFIMLVSNHFKYGALVIATESMTGELNKGDVSIFEAYDSQPIEIGQVIVFERDGAMIIHRVVDIERVNGEHRYYTKGDVNENRDAGYAVRGDIRGLVYCKVPYLGYPTLWLRSFFVR